MTAARGARAGTRSGELGRTDVYRVTFRGDRSGIWPATYTQDNVLDWVAREPAAAILNLMIEIPDGSSVERIGSAVSTVLERHESLRTIFPAVGSGERLQQVLGRGTINLVLGEGAATCGRPRKFRTSV